MKKACSTVTPPLSQKKFLVMQISAPHIGGLMRAYCIPLCPAHLTTPVQVMGLKVHHFKMIFLQIKQQVFIKDTLVTNLLLKAI